ncbi:MAG: (2Fe-2S)-binding protein [Pyrinomonadaceae bacterium]
MNRYPEKIAAIIESAEHFVEFDGDSSGISGDFSCGVAVAFEVAIDESTTRINRIGFQTAGCGYVVAAAETVAGYMKGRTLRSCGGGLPNYEKLLELLGEVPESREHCYKIVIEALVQTIRNYRIQKSDLWDGDEALVCSCFGVSEQDIQTAMSECNADSTTEVGKLTRAGLGCGSCLPVIEDILKAVEQIGS